MSRQNEVKSDMESELSRDLTLFHLTMMGAGMMIGAGVFVATGIAIGVSGPGGILISFSLNGLIALFSAMSYAELASGLPAAGGAYTYVNEAFKGFTGFISGWMNWFALAVAGSLYAITFSTYTIHLLKDLPYFTSMGLSLGILEKIVAIMIAIIFIMINYLGASETGNTASIIAVGQTLTLGIVGIVGILVALNNPESLSNFSNFVPKGWNKILVAMGFTYVGFEGYEVIGHAGEEAINPKKDVPKAIFYALIIVVSTYILVAFAAIIGAKPEGMAIWQWFQLEGATGLADAIKNLMPFGGVLIVLAAIFSSTSALNSTVFSSARVSFALGRDGYLPSKLSEISSKRKIPHYALFSSSAIILIVAAALPVEDIAASADIMFLLIFLLVNASVIKIRKEKGKELDYGYIMPYFPYVPIIAIIAQLILSIWLLDMSLIAWLTTGLWVGVGLLVYYAYPSPEKIKPEKAVFKEKIREKARDFQVLVPISNPNTAKVLLNYAKDIIETKNGEIVVMSAEKASVGTGLKDTEKISSDRKELIKKFKKEIENTQPVKGLIRFGRNIPNAIIGAAKDRDTDLLIIGWDGKAEKYYYKVGTVLDEVIERIPTDTLIIKPGENTKQPGKIDRILLPTKGGIHSLMAAEIGKILQKTHNADIKVLSISKEDESDSTIKRRIKPILNELKEDYNLKITQGENVTEIILNEAENTDLILMGSTEEGFFQKLIFGTIPRQIGTKTEKTVIITKKNKGLTSWFKRWFK